ncbi:MAG: hypothetical protein DYG98_09475 [Haliscomenobacteraceae bacterium CHB4]|nr:hypothetical protein [Haliscomenobacteraceae bacterium CHB4]
MSENIDDKTLRDYAANALAGDDLREFEHRLQTDPELQAELDLYLALKAADNLRLKKQLARTAADARLAPLAPPRALIRRIPVWIAAAASLALALTAVWWWQQSARPDATQLAQSYIETPYPPPVASMGASDTLPAALQRAYLAYRTGDFAAAAEQLAVLANSPDALDEILFYVGESSLQTGQTDRAIGYFDRVRPGYWRESADWRCALALLRSGQTDRARVLLEQLRQTGRKTQAEALLEAIK